MSHLYITHRYNPHHRVVIISRVPVDALPTLGQEHTLTLNLDNEPVTVVWGTSLYAFVIIPRAGDRRALKFYTRDVGLLAEGGDYTLDRG